MRNYEFTVIFDANEDQTAKGLELVLAEFTTAQVEITKQEDMGVKNLAYLIKKQDKGHYYFFELKADPSVINGFNNTFKLMTPLLKFLFVNKDTQV
ncbi:MAG: 30S ribosomal protein S6 [Spirochaetae bacterium HGW-Spirochaetae-4]|jgi:small subunit ribosomal protein S6|nr:MAG: 30S ribosomal protein S6 [Spirochaetes bacterium GWC2_52_13]OHD66816.1 MAG: 30S ribosomal protein S6 [Spirochaetes bacterium GWF2_52_7]PKL21327.1 MAG: 30S ribosomal protein S6 [Spirochaetae bacterium HGW-Spirochaetae-4]HCG64300.1 30S ribosomal protein S6 [Sphaerochaeta sp.]HCS37346.1 30S ribosomal protein S6 [Sphaerochaeta sp.]